MTHRNMRRFQKCDAFRSSLKTLRKRFQTKEDIQKLSKDNKKLGAALPVKDM